MHCIGDGDGDGDGVAGGSGGESRAVGRDCSWHKTTKNNTNTKR